MNELMIGSLLMAAYGGACFAVGFLIGRIEGAARTVTEMHVIATSDDDFDARVTRALDRQRRERPNEPVVAVFTGRNGVPTARVREG